MSLDVHRDTPMQPRFDETFRKHLIDRPGRLIFAGTHLTRQDSVRCLVRYISRQGADLEVSPFLGVSEQFNLIIQGSEIEIASHLIRREDERVYIAFHSLISPSHLYMLRRLSLESGE